MQDTHDKEGGGRKGDGRLRGVMLPGFSYDKFLTNTCPQIPELWIAQAVTSLC